jgi:hypothetical protein
MRKFDHILILNSCGRNNMRKQINDDVEMQPVTVEPTMAAAAQSHPVALEPTAHIVDHDINKKLIEIREKFTAVHQIKQLLLFEQAARLMLMENQNNELSPVLTSFLIDTSDMMSKPFPDAIYDASVTDKWFSISDREQIEVLERGLDSHSQDLREELEPSRRSMRETKYRRNNGRRQGFIFARDACINAPEFVIKLTDERAALVKKNEELFSFGNSVATLFAPDVNRTRDEIACDAVALTGLPH